MSSGFASEVTVDNSGREISNYFSFDEPGISHNYQAGAIVISHEEDWCSEEGAYTTTGMSPEGEKISCSNDAQSRNDVWFKFQASSDQVELEVNPTGASPTEQSWI